MGRTRSWKLVALAGLAALLTVAGVLTGAARDDGGDGVLAGLPDAERNALRGRLEVVESFAVSGQQDIRHVVDPGVGQARDATRLTSHPAPDLDPRVAIDPAGNTWVVWWRDTTIDQVLLRKYTVEFGSWNGEVPFSERTESSRHPEILHDGRHAWMVWEFDAAAGVSVAVRRGDGPAPWPPRSVLRTTAWTGDLDASIHIDAGQLWVSWVDAADELGWSEYDEKTETWSETRFEKLGEDGVAAARERVRDRLAQ
jgi:hypothetical protein